ncbi:uncharacterized protein EURHEDRAFT_303585 [Aspergillus ruber CBS 135680]|uniref:Uncharacterized protein n=1 Tax=Aspergillus ruber (strain CBS 135680) TaxID=1388766 RepID=A0A017SL92_ASPRC|nr:uncharacterized protein EURHEDRAFT_303585 [Aspergillus ruber CBS 135680]EYE97717.1 hypothetical protein EURHEDRAFT_303585 [Aspergillus ruber CBS 135680]
MYYMIALLILIAIVSICSFKLVLVLCMLVLLSRQRRSRAVQGRSMVGKPAGLRSRRKKATLDSWILICHHPITSFPYLSVGLFCISTVTSFLLYFSVCAVRHNTLLLIAPSHSCDFPFLLSRRSPTELN